MRTHRKYHLLEHRVMRCWPRISELYNLPGNFEFLVQSCRAVLKLGDVDFSELHQCVDCYRYIVATM